MFNMKWDEGWERDLIVENGSNPHPYPTPPLNNSIEVHYILVNSIDKASSCYTERRTTKSEQITI